MPSDSSANASARRASSRQGSLSARQLREVRKELLVARASIERLTIVEASTDLSQRISRFGWLGLLVPGFARRAQVGDGNAWLAGLPGFLQPALQAVLPLLRRHPVGAAVISLLLGLPGSGALRRAGGSAKWAGAALLGLKAYRLWRRVSDYRAERRQRKQSSSSHKQAKSTQ